MKIEIEITGDSNTNIKLFNHFIGYTVKHDGNNHSFYLAYKNLRNAKNELKAVWYELKDDGAECPNDECLKYKGSMAMIINVDEVYKSE